jgi:hypothetical protein
VGQLWRFVSHTSRFRRLRGHRVLLRYAPGLQDTVDLPAYMRGCEQALQDLTHRFGLRLRRRLVVFLFAGSGPMSQVFRSRLAGWALPGGDAIGVAAGVPVASLNERTRHELAHLFAGYWGRRYLALKDEGLATWLEGGIDGKPVDFLATVSVLAGPCFPLVCLLDGWHFDPAPYPYNYAVAGSFTGHLVRRFGWEAYRNFYLRADAHHFEAAFLGAFGQSLPRAERQWRDELLAGRRAFEPDVSRVLSEHSIESAYNSWQLYRCLQESECLCRSGPCATRVLQIAASAHALLGHYDRAIALMEQLLERTPDHPAICPTELWTQAGCLYDLLAQRDQAVAAYRKALAEPDSWNPYSGSTHALARRCLQKPFTEEHVTVRLRSLISPQPSAFVFACGARR